MTVKNSPSFAIITPSYAPDFERCKLLVESVYKFVDPPVNHYIIVDREDLNLFKTLANQRVTLLTKEDIFPFWISQVSLWAGQCEVLKP